MEIWFVLLISLFAVESDKPVPAAVAYSQAECENKAGRLNKMTEVERRADSKQNKGVLFVCAKVVPPQA